MATTGTPRNKVLSVVSNLLSYKKSEKNGNKKQVQQVSGVLVSVVLSMLSMHTVSFTVLLLNLHCIIQVSSGVVVQHHDDSGSSYLVSAAHEWNDIIVQIQ